jgi:hypothetical protein
MAGDGDALRLPALDVLQRQGALAPAGVFKSPTQGRNDAASIRHSVVAESVQAAWRAGWSSSASRPITAPAARNEHAVSSPAALVDDKRIVPCDTYQTHAGGSPSLISKVPAGRSTR